MDLSKVQAILNKVAEIAKAVVAGVAVASAQLAIALQDGQVTTIEGLTIVTLTAAAAGAVWAVPNREPGA